MEDVNCKKKPLNNTSRKCISFKHRKILITDENIKKILDMYELPYDTDFEDFLNFRNQFRDNINIYHKYKKFKEDNHLTWSEVKKLKLEEILRNNDMTIFGHRDTEVTSKIYNMIDKNNDSVR